MNAQMLLENFGHIANAPGGVKRLREMIMWSAFSGMLSGKPRTNLLPESFKIEGRPFSHAIPDDWEWKSGQDVFDIIRGVSYKKNESSNNQFDASTPLLRANNIGRSVNFDDLFYIPQSRVNHEQYLRNGDILIAMSSGSKNLVGKAAQFLGNFECTFGAFCGVVRNKSNITDDYLARYFQSPQYTSWVTSAGRGIGINNLGKGDLASLPIPCPSLSEQKRIVAKVDELMALYDKLEAQQQERERRFPVLSRACHARFVEAPTLANLKAIFDEAGSVSTEEMRNTVLNLAVKGNLVQQYPTDEPAEQWLLHFQKRNPDKPTYNRTASGTVIGGTWILPDGWITTQLDQLFIVSGGIQKTPRRTPRDNAFPYLGVANVYRNRLDLTNVKKFELEDGELERYRLEAGDLLIIEGNGSIDQVGRCAQWNGQIENCVHQNHIIRCRPIDPEIGSFILLFLNSPIGMEIMKELAITSSGLYSLSVGKIRKIQLRIPPIREQRRIVAKVNQLMALIDTLEEQQVRKAKVAQAFAQAAVSAITGTEIKEPEKMKAPKTELVSRLQTKNTPNAADPAPLTKLLTEHNGELPAKALWQRSGLEIDAFYQQLRTEMANGWIIEPEKAVMKEIEAD